MLGCVWLWVCRLFDHICKASDSFLALSLSSLLPWFRVSHWPGSSLTSITQPTLRVCLSLPCNTGVQVCLPWLFNMNAGDLNLGTYTYKSKCSYPLSQITIHPNVVVVAVLFLFHLFTTSYNVHPDGSFLKTQCWARQLSYLLLRPD